MDSNYGYYQSIIKLNAAGEPEWQTPVKYNYFAHSIQQTSDSGYLVTSFIDSAEKKGIAVILKLDKNGNTVW